MQHVVDYIRQNAATSAPSSIDAQLRQAGYSEAAIRHAWSVASVAPVPGHAAGAAVMGGGPQMGGTRPTSALRPRYLRVALVACAALVAGGAYVALAGNGTGTIASNIRSIAPGDGLPSGWEATSDRMWMDTEHGNSVLLTEAETQGHTLDSYVDARVGVMKAAGATIESGPEQATFQGRDSLRVTSEMGAGELRARSTGWYFMDDDAVMIVEVRVGADGSQSQADEAFEVANAIKLPA